MMIWPDLELRPLNLEYCALTFKLCYLINVLKRTENYLSIHQISFGLQVCTGE